MANVLFFYIAGLLVVVLAVALHKPLEVVISLPKGSQWWWILLCALIFFFADFAYFAAYHGGGSLIMISTTIMLFPVFASLIKSICGDGYLSWIQFLGWFFADIEVLLVNANKQ